MGNCALNFFYYFDCYLSAFQLLFKQSPSYRTKFGALVSILVYLLTLVVFVFLLVFLIKKTEENIATFEEKNVDPPIFNVYTNIDKIKYSKESENKAFFMPFILIYKEGKGYVTLDDVKDDISILAVNTLRNNGEKNSSYPSNTTSIVSCQDYLGTDINRYSYILNSKLLNYSYCLKATDDMIQFGGAYISPVYYYTQIKILVQNSNWKNLNNVKIIFGYSDYSITSDMPDEAPIIYSIKITEFAFLEKYSINVDAFISLDNFESKDNYCADWREEKKIKLARINKMEKNIKNYNSADNEAITITLRAEYNYKRYLRTYKSLYKFLGQIGGFFKVLVFIGVIIVAGFNTSMMNVDISNSLFNMIHPNNQHNVSMKYKEYLEKEKYYERTAPLLKSINPVLKEMAYDYYKYERNKGLQFTANEFFSQNFCCCIKKGNINAKAKIFERSQQEIESCLETVNVAKFASSSKLIRKLLLNDEEIMIGYLAENNLELNNLYKIFENFKKQQALEKSSILNQAYHKQNYFIKGLTNIRNQGDISKKDILTVDLLNLDHQLVQKYFVNFKKKFDDFYHPQSNDQ